MKVYYWNKKNFGDLLTPLLLKKFCRIDSEWTPAAESELVMVGSLVEHLPQSYQGIIAGIGKLHESKPVNFPDAKILAFRGPLTAKGIKGDFILADFGLIANELVPLQDKKYDLGIIPHWTDKTLETNPVFKRYHPHIIRVSDDPLEVIKQISQCKKVVSSSLHGIILADAFNIPRRVEIPPRSISHSHQEGGLFKWRDYHQSIGMKLEVGKTVEADRNIITDKQHEIFDVLQEIKAYEKTKN